QIHRDASLNPTVDAFLVLLDPSKAGFGAGLVYGTYLGGDGEDLAASITLEGGSQVAVAGYTESGNYPVTPNALQSARPGRRDGFVTRLQLGRPGAQSLVYSSYLGGASDDAVYGAARGPSGTLYLAGYSQGPLFPDPQTNAATSGFFVS